MNILHVIASANPSTGGPVEAIVRLGSTMFKLGHRAEVLTLDDPASPWLKAFSLPVFAVGPSTQLYAYTPRLAGWLKYHEHRYDVVVLHGLWNYSSFGSWRGLRRNTPYVIFVHGMLDPWFRFAHPLKHWAKQLYWLGAEGRVLRDAKAVLFTNEQERCLAEGSFWGYHYLERVVAFGTKDVEDNPALQLSSFRASVPRLQQRKFLLFLSRIHPKKGCDLLIQAFAKVAIEHPLLDLVIVGPDQDGEKATLELQARKLGIDDRIHWPGMLTGDSKWGAFRAAEAFVLPSHQENFGIAVAEAMACRTPVLITNKVNIWREVEACGGGLIANDDAEDIGRMLDRYLRLDYAEKEVMRERARSGFLAHFGIESAARDLTAVCEEAMHRHGAARRQAD